MNYKSAARIPCLLLVGACIHRSYTPPQPPAAKQDRAKAPQGTFADRTLTRLIELPYFNILSALKLSTWLPVLAECVIVLANNGLLPAGWNERVLSLLTGTPSRTLVAQTLSPVLISAAVLATAGTSIRMAAYAALGRQFTYEVAIQDDYTLVTAFPYNLVRHPSYLGMVSTMAGAYLSLAPRDGWARAVFGPWLASKPLTLGKVMAGAAAVGVVTSNVLVVMMFRSRLNREDVMLRKQFGRQWDDWAERVPNQIIPYV